MLRFSPVLSLGLLCGFTATIGLSDADAAECKSLRGHYEEAIFVAGCTSPVGLCTSATLLGPFTGNALFSATTITPTVDTPTTGVVFVIGDTTVTDARFAYRSGTLLIKNAAAFSTVTGDLSDTQTIIGGTGGLTGAFGSLRVSGVIDNATGTGTMFYEGSICLP